VVSYCPGHDPILHAAPITCGNCGAVSWPADAEWVTGALVLAAYAPEHERGCPSRGLPAAVLLDVSQNDPEVPALPQRPRRCRGTAATTGRRCRGYARPGSAFCVRHDPLREPR
jgi:hypothetical protein